MVLSACLTAKFAISLASALSLCCGWRLILIPLLDGYIGCGRCRRRCWSRCHRYCIHKFFPSCALPFSTEPIEPLARIADSDRGVAVPGGASGAGASSGSGSGPRASDFIGLSLVRSLSCSLSLFPLPSRVALSARCYAWSGISLPTAACSQSTADTPRCPNLESPAKPALTLT